MDFIDFIVKGMGNQLKESEKYINQGFQNKENRIKELLNEIANL